MRKFVLIIFLTQCAKSALGVDSLYYVFTKVEIDGYVYNFLIDNGAERSVMIKNRVNKIYSLRPVSKIIGVNYDTITLYMTTRKLNLNLIDIGVTYKMHIGVIDSMPSIAQKIGIDGIIGNDILSKHDWKIDFIYNKISIVNKKKLKLSKKEFRIMDFDEGNYISVNIETSNRNIIRTKVEIDLGCHCYMDVWDSLNVTSDSILKVSRRYSVSTFREQYSHICASNISFDGFEIYGLPVDFKLQKSRNLIGIKFFSMHDEVYLIYSERKIYLPKIDSKKIKINRLGFYNGILESYMDTKDNFKPKWNLGQMAEEGFEMINEGYFSFDVFFNDK